MISNVDIYLVINAISLIFVSLFMRSASVINIVVGEYI